MIMPDIEALVSLFRKQGLGEVRQGCIEVDSLVVSTPDEAMKALKNHGGQGWICLANTREVLRISDTADLAISKDDWIECCEVARDASSMHISADGRGGWNVVTLRENPSRDGIIVHHSLLTSDGKGALAYDVSWSPAPGHQSGIGELCPAAWRFTGFEEANMEDI